MPISEVKCCDCMDFMKQFPDNFFDLAIVDPPYGIGISNSKEIGYKGKNVYKPKQWDKKAPNKSYFVELFRASKNQIVWGGAITSIFRRRGASWFGTRERGFITGLTPKESLRGHLLMPT